MDGRPNQKLTLPSSHSVFLQTQQRGRPVTPRRCPRVSYPNLSIPGTRPSHAIYIFQLVVSHHPWPALRTLSLYRGVKAFRKVEALIGDSSVLRRSRHNNTSERNDAYAVQEAKQCNIHLMHLGIVFIRVRTCFHVLFFFPCEADALNQAIASSF